VRTQRRRRPARLTDSAEGRDPPLLIQSGGLRFRNRKRARQERIAAVLLRSGTRARAAAGSALPADLRP